MKTIETPASAEIRMALGNGSLGRILVACNAGGVCALLLGDDDGALRAELDGYFPRARIARCDDSLQPLLARAQALVDTPSEAGGLSLDVGGTPFQQRVWQALGEIPPGTTASYAQVAARIGRPDAVRAVAGACAANVLAIAIPCHRVTRKDGSLSGYRWGVERKRELLRREAQA